MTKAEVEQLAWGRWYASGNVLLEITDERVGGKSAGSPAWQGHSGFVFLDDDLQRGLRFYVHHGTTGGQGYLVHIHRCLLGTFARYSIEWVS